MRAAHPLAAILLAAAPAAAAPVAVAWPLDDATNVVLVEDHRAPLVSLEVELPAGRWSPWFRERHAEEAFEISFHDSGGALRRKADRLGVTLELAAGRRSSVLKLECLKEDLDGALGLVREVLANRDLDRRELKRMKAQRRIEWERSQREPGVRARQALARALFAPGDPRRREAEKPEPVSTDVPELVAARDALVRLPGRAIGLAGDLTRTEAERAASGLLPPAGPRPAGLEPDLAPVSPPGDARNVTVELPRLTQAYFAYGRDSVPFGDPDYPAFLLADHVLGGHFYSRLLVALRHEGGETYGATTRNLGDTAPGAYAMGTFTRAPNADAAEAKLREVLRTLHDGGIAEDERAAAAGALLGARLLERQSPKDVLERRLREWRLGLPPGFFDEAAERASRLSLAEVNRFVSRFYDPAAFGMVRVAPER